jgi:hypothetical protein
VKPRIGDYKEITVERHGKKPLRGQMWIEDDMVVVQSEDGRHKSTALGKALPEETAKHVLIELEGSHGPSAGAPVT